MRIPNLLAVTVLALAAAVAAAASAKPKPHSHGAHATAPKASKPAGKQALNACTQCTERRAVLDPKRFADTRVYDPEAARAYEVARLHPATLDRLHCFCECQESLQFKHKTLLTCFTDEHAAGCGICIKEALLAAELKGRGALDEEIEVLVESSFRTDGHAPTHGRR